jgi:hypothetical protein
MAQDYQHKSGGGMDDILDGELDLTLFGAASEEEAERDLKYAELLTQLETV